MSIPVVSLHAVANSKTLSGFEDPGRPFWNRLNPPPPLHALLVVLPQGVADASAAAVGLVVFPSAGIELVRRLKPNPLFGRIFGLHVEVGSLVAFEWCFRFRACMMVMSVRFKKYNGTKKTKSKGRQGGAPDECCFDAKQCNTQNGASSRELQSLPVR
jgi:hypothetical protein